MKQHGNAGKSSMKNREVVGTLTFLRDKFLAVYRAARGGVVDGRRLLLVSTYVRLSSTRSLSAKNHAR